MTHKQRIIKKAMIAMQEFICGESKTPEEFDRFFRKLFREIYDEAWTHGSNN